MIAHVGIQMLEGNCQSGSSSRAAHDLVSLLAQSRPEQTAPGDYMGAAMHGNKVEHPFYPKMLNKGVYEDPTLWDSRLGYVNMSKKAAKSPRNRRGSITQRFVNETQESGWNNSAKVPAPSPVPERLESPTSTISTSTSIAKHTENRMLDSVNLVKQRLIGASYRNGRRDYKHLFRYYDRSKSGMISQDAFISLMRCDCKFKPGILSDKALCEIFSKIDRNMSGQVSYQDFEEWITRPPSKVSARKRVPKLRSQTPSSSSLRKNSGDVFERLGRASSFTGTARRKAMEAENKHRYRHDYSAPPGNARTTPSLSIMDDIPAEPAELDEFSSVVAVAQARTQIPHDKVSAHFSLSLRQDTRLSPTGQVQKPFTFDHANAWKTLKTPSAAIGRIVPEQEYFFDHSEKGVGKIHALETRLENARLQGHRRRNSIMSAAKSSGYGRLSPTMYSSPAQRRFSTSQGFVVPSSDLRRAEFIREEGVNASKRTGVRRQSTRASLHSPAQFIKLKLRAAAYDKGDVKLAKIYNSHYRSNEGLISAKEFTSLMRKVAKIPPHQMSDRRLCRIFERDVDLDGTGQVDYRDFINWFANDDDEAKKLKLDMITMSKRKAIALADKVVELAVEEL